MGWLKNSDNLIKYLSTEHSQGLLSRKEGVICLLLISSHFLPSRLTGPPRLECRGRGTKDSCGLVLSKASCLFSGPERILGLTLFPSGFLRGFPASTPGTVPSRRPAVFPQFGSHTSGTRINNGFV